MAIEFGTTPEPGNMNLSRYGDFVTEVVSDDGDWAAGSELEFRFLPAGATEWVVWSATIAGDTARWNVDKAAVATVLDTGVKTYRLFYVSGDYDLEYSKGPIRDVS